MQSKSGVGSKGFALRQLGQNFAVQSMMALAVLTPLMVPLATYATRSQTSNTTPGADVSNIAAVAAAEGASAASYNPAADAPETSSDKGFSTDDFLNPDDGTKPKPKRAVVTFAPVAGPRHSNDYNVTVRINVPQNTDPVDRFVAYPYPMPVPIPKKPPGSKGAPKGTGAPPATPAAGSAPTAGATPAPAPSAPPDKPAVAEQAYDKMPRTRTNIRALILQTGYTTRQKKTMPYPQGGWRWQMAYRNALARCHKSEPSYIGEMYSFVDAMEPLCKEECEKFDELEEDRQRRYQTAFEEYQINRNECEYDAVRKGYFPVEFNMSRGYRGVLAAAELKLPPGTWWITGTHKVTGLLYYWQMPIQVSSSQVENVELNWKNALMIQGGW